MSTLEVLWVVALAFPDGEGVSSIEAPSTYHLGFGANETLHFRTFHDGACYRTSQLTRWIYSLLIFMPYTDDAMSTLDVLWVVALAFPDGEGVSSIEAPSTYHLRWSSVEQ
jgi:hypothetical protein